MDGDGRWLEGGGSEIGMLEMPVHLFHSFLSRLMALLAIGVSAYVCVWQTWWIVVWARKHAEMAWPLQGDSGSENGGLWRRSGGVPLTVLSPGKHVLSGAHFKVFMFMFLLSICIIYFLLLQRLVFF